MSDVKEETAVQIEQDVRNKAIRLFTYLKEVCQLRFIMVRDCRNYDQVLWFNEIPREPECFCVAWSASTETSESWVEIRRSSEPVWPDIPDACKDWVSLAEIRDSSQIPTLRERILRPSLDGVEPAHIELAEHPEVTAKWQAFLQSKWQPWAKEHQRWLTVQQVYGKLFSMYQQQKRLGEAFELRLGLGLLSCQTPSGDRIYRHLLVGRANITFDANRGVISVQANSDGVKLSLEHDMLDPAQLPTPEQYEAVECGVEANSETPWDRNLIEPHLRAWVQAMDQRGRYDESLEAPSSVSLTPQITFAPALILRRRSARTLVKLLGDIAKNINLGGKVPFGVQRLCEIVGDAAPDETDTPAGETPSSPDPEIYFPMPSNDEQRKIVQRLSLGRGVLVQGPPGTGKSHTIANLICHLLAKKKRVLVTSQTPRALKVLQDKIRKDAGHLAPLCVSLLGNDATALKNMEDSVVGITGRHSDWESGGRERNTQAISRLEERLHSTRKRLAEAETRIRQLREMESYRHSIANGAYQGTAAQIARRLVTERDHFGWVTDHIDEGQPLPISVESFTNLLALLRRLQPERCAELARPFVALDELPDVEAFFRLTAQERSARQVCEAHASREASATYKTLLHCGKKERQNALEKLQRLQTAIGNILRRPMSWIPRSVNAILSDQDRAWRELHDATTYALRRRLINANLSERVRKAATGHLQLAAGLDRHKVLADARDLQTHFKRGGRLGFSFFRAAIVKRALYLTHQVRVNGRTCGTPEVLSELIEHLDLEISVDALWAQWSEIAERPTGLLPRQVAELEQCNQALELVLGLKESLEQAKQAIKQLQNISEPAWYEHDAVKALVADLEAAEARDALTDLQAQIASIEHILCCAEVRPKAHPINAVLLQAVRERDTKTYSDRWNQLRQLTEDREASKVCDSLRWDLHRHLPDLVALLEQDFSNSIWDDRLAHIQQAWNWSQANSWLTQFGQRQEGEKLDAEFKTLQRTVQRTISELAAEKAWQHCLARLTEAQRQHLMGWTWEMSKVGRGKGRTVCVWR